MQGAAQAVYAVDALAAVYPSTPITMYSFGTPRPGDAAFAARLNSTTNLHAVSSSSSLERCY